MAEAQSWESPLRDLARKLRATAKEHFCYSQVIELMAVVDMHINAMAYIEEIHQRSNQR
jgi:hypothetical protein